MALNRFAAKISFIKTVFVGRPLCEKPSVIPVTLDRSDIVVQTSRRTI